MGFEKATSIYRGKEYNEGKAFPENKTTLKERIEEAKKRPAVGKILEDVNHPIHKIAKRLLEEHGAFSKILEGEFYDILENEGFDDAVTAAVAEELEKKRTIQ